ncbi:MAG TPA: type II toxin-antitoxin system RelE/ParE family toxin [Verrucomicrobiae bacterium]|jgi:plasmid stabilization system protein ParE|nr:type II toxin-antitoxin system RelE/ParE family toxin [Verrucomicrobiae bacterium]
MKSRYVLSLEAADDLVSIWRYIQEQSSRETADRIESDILDRIAFLSRNPGSGHRRKELTDFDVRFFPSSTVPTLRRCKLSLFSTDVVM